MNKAFIILKIFFLSAISAGEISVSISEDLVNEYLQLIGNHDIPKGKKGDQALWSIKNPYVKFEHGSAEFFSIVTFAIGSSQIGELSYPLSQG